MPAIYTIGYEGSEIGRFVAALLAKVSNSWPTCGPYPCREKKVSRKRPLAPRSEQPVSITCTWDIWAIRSPGGSLREPVECGSFGLSTRPTSRERIRALH